MLLAIRRCLAGGLILCWFACAAPAAAQLPQITGAGSEAKAPAAETPKEAKEEEKKGEKLDAEREEVNKQLMTARRVLQASENGSAGTTAAPEKVTREVELLSQIELALGQQKAVFEQKKELETTRDDLQAKLDALHGAGGGDAEPLTFFELDRLRDELAAEQTRSITFDTVISSSKQSLERARQASADKERERLKAKELLETNRDEGSVGKLTQQHTLAEHEAKLAAETVKLRQAQYEVEQLNRQVHELRVATLEQQIQQHAASARFTKADLDAKLDEIASEEDGLREKIALAERSFASQDARWVDKKHEFDMSADPSPKLREEVEYQRLARQTWQQQITVLAQRLERLGRMRTAYKRRFEVINGTPPAADLKAWETEARQYLEQLAQEARLQSVRVDQLRKDLLNLDAKLQAAQELPPEAKTEINLQQKELAKLDPTYNKNYVSIETTRRLYEKLLTEIGSDVESLSAAERAAVVWQWVVDIWNYPLMSVEDHPITPGKIVSGLVLLLLGYAGSRFLSGLLGRRLLPRVGMNESASTAIQSLAFYSLVAMVTLLALHLVNVPLTLFTFLGGALAIGVGFGSQNIVNNFISGLILLAERPIRHGDMIELDGLYGTIEHIGARSTRVKTFTNVEIIVPNSSFLENNVVNWTLSDDRIRAGIKIGVAYGSPTREVARLLKRAADEHGLIMRSPEPFVWFTDFGDNALQFELNFWVAMRTLSERMRIESDIRHKVDSLFREAGIVIAYPQRDVHLDALRPIEVRMLSPAAAEEPARREAA